MGYHIAFNRSRNIIKWLQNVVLSSRQLNKPIKFIQKTLRQPHPDLEPPEVFRNLINQYRTKEIHIELLHNTMGHLNPHIWIWKGLLLDRHYPERQEGKLFE